MIDTVSAVPEGKAMWNWSVVLKEMLPRTNVPPIVRAVRADSLTYLGVHPLTDLYEEVQRLEQAGMEGSLVEGGCALGGSSIVMATAKSRSRAFHVYDTFGMIPPPSAEDGQDVHDRYKTIQSGKSKGIRGQKYYGYEENLLDRVRASFARHGVPVEECNVQLVRGLFQDTMQISQPVALAHVDGDWYESVKVCLERIEPQLVPGGVLVIDDYYHWSGCRKAVDEYFEGRKDRYDFIVRSRLHVRKRS